MEICRAMCGRVGKEQRSSCTEGKRILGMKRLHPHSGDKHQNEQFESATDLCLAHPCVCTAPPGWKIFVHFSLVPALAAHPWQQQQQMLIFQSICRGGVSGIDGLLHIGAQSSGSGALSRARLWSG